SGERGPRAIRIAAVVAVLLSVAPAPQLRASRAPDHRIASALAHQRSDTGATAVVTGTVYDSVARAPIAGAEIQLVDLADRRHAYTAEADSLGRFRIDSVKPGNYAAGFFAPALDALGIEPLVRGEIVRAGSDNFIALVIPGPISVMGAVCPARPPNDSTGALAGQVRGADSGIPISHAKIVVSWLEVVIDKRGLVTQQRRVPAETGENGEYRICGLPGADTVLVSAALASQQSGVIEVAIPVGEIVRHDFTIGDSTTATLLAADTSAVATTAKVRSQTAVRRGSASLAGSVVGPDGKPMSGVKVTVWGTGLEATTRSDGRFRLAGLPAGTFSVEARAIGYDPKRAAVDLSSAKEASVRLAFVKRVNELSRVVVMGKPTNRFHDIDEFLARARSGMGHYLMGGDERLKTAVTVTDAMRNIAGVNIVPSGEFGNVILLRGRCTPVVYVDGVEMHDGYQSVDDIVPPQQVAGIEVYTGLGEAPIQYTTNGCGVVLVWTKR
ncbi:MAG: Plug and carboxypeptidase regulatory-like domain-containing protein, partial [Gemmatimonadota bacterium]|nr:Plug and carboxypeptidase regulatory-like domain-containing protein [Gemmatimonadota bacterium]